MAAAQLQLQLQAQSCVAAVDAGVACADGYRELWGLNSSSEGSGNRCLWADRVRCRSEAAVAQLLRRKIVSGPQRTMTVGPGRNLAATPASRLAPPRNARAQPCPGRASDYSPPPHA